MTVVNIEKAINEFATKKKLNLDEIGISAWDLAQHIWNYIGD